MGRIIAGQIRGMGLVAKLGLVMVLTVLISTFMYQGWYKPTQAKAAVRTYYMTFSNGTAFSIPSGKSTNTTCPTSSDTAMGTTPAVGILNDADSAACVPISNRDITYNSANTFTLYYNGPGYTQVMNVTGTSVSIRARSNISASMTITPRLFYTTPAGTKTYFTGSTAGKSVGTIRTTLSFSLTGQSAANIPAGSKLGIQFSMNTDSRVSVNDDSGLTDELIVAETPVAVSSNANLSGLSISAGTLSPSFSGSTTYYTTSVANSVASITVTPTEEDPAATTTVNGISVNSGSASGPIALSVGSNTISTVVTAQNGTSKTYTIVVNRATVPSTNANLSSLTLSSGALTPTFTGSTIYYTASVSNATPSITVTPTAEDANATIKVNGIAVTTGTASIPFALIVGANGFNVAVTAPDGSTINNYTLVITREAISNNANLSNLVLSSGSLNPTFYTNTTSYNVTVANTVSIISVTPTAQDASATIRVNGIRVTSGTNSTAFALAVGANTFNIVVTAQDGTIKTYSVVVTRQPALSNNANLSNLNLSSGTLIPGFSSSTSNYTADVVNSVSTITVNPTAQDINAAIKVNGISVTSGTASVPFALTTGANSLSVLVTAPNGITTKTYNIIVNRAASVINNTTAGPLTFSGITASSITVTAPFTGDANGNNSCIIRWGSTAGNYPNTATSTRSGSSYSATISSGILQGTTYYFQAMFNDIDGITGSPVTGSQLTTSLGYSSPLMHNGINLGTKYNGGSWGISFSCSTCHSKNTTNIKRVIETIPATIGAPLTKTIRYRNVTSMGNDGDLHSTSSRICEACHTQTTVHRHNTAGQSDFNHMGSNNIDCTSCHRHKNAFGASCNVCHGYPPIAATTGEDGLAEPATGILPSGQYGAHIAHVVDKNMSCEGCHQGYTTAPMGNNSIELGFKLAGDTVTGFGSSITTGSFSGKTPAAPYAGIVSKSVGTTVTTSSSGTNTCSVYCHGAWATSSGGAVTIPAWSGSLAGSGCNACHGASASMIPSPAYATGAHSRHAGNAAGGLARGCSNCHGDVSDSDHLDGLVRWDFASFGGNAAYAPPNTTPAGSGYTNGPAQTAIYGTCQNIYCHSQVQNPVTGMLNELVYGTPQWGGSPIGCNSCHADMSGPNGSGSHVRHAYSSVMACTTCHFGAGQDTQMHANSTIDINFSGSATGGQYSQGSSIAGNGYGSCSAIYCHSDGRSITGPYTQNIPPTWGSGTIGCNSCHSGGPGGGTQGPTYTSGKANSHPKHFFTCDKCHACMTDGTGVVTAPDLHGNKDYNLQNGGNALFTVTQLGTPATPTQCSNISCHTNGTAIWGQTLSCGSCHINMATNIGTGSHPRHASAYPFDCSVCHGNGYTGSAVTSQTHGDSSVNLGFTGTAVGTVYNKGTTFNTGTAYGTCSASYCHSEGTSFTPPFVQQTIMNWGAPPAASAATTARQPTSAARQTATPNTTSAATSATAMCMTAFQAQSTTRCYTSTSITIFKGGVVLALRWWFRERQPILRNAAISAAMAATAPRGAVESFPAAIATPAMLILIITSSAMVPLLKLMPTSG